MMACLTALYSQILTLLSVPHEILFLQHKVFREYAKTAVGPDFIHTLPSFMILMAMMFVLWRNPPSLNSVSDLMGLFLYKTLQVMVSWVVAITSIWVWLIFQRLLYCCIWASWSYESDYRTISFEWWQRVWTSYPLLEPPVLSAGFISWIISMSIATVTLGCAVSADFLQNFTVYIVNRGRDVFVRAKCRAISYFKSGFRFPLLQYCQTQEEAISKTIMVDESEASSMCDECRSEISSEVTNPCTMDVHPVSYGTNWTPKPSFTGYKGPQRRASLKSTHTVAIVNDIENSVKVSPRQLRHRRGCHTVMPSNSSDKSSGC